MLSQLSHGTVRNLMSNEVTMTTIFPYTMSSSFEAVRLSLPLSVIVFILLNNVQSVWIQGDDFQEEVNIMKNQGLGVHDWQTYFDSLTFSPDIPNGDTLVDQLSSKLSSKFQNKIGKLKSLKAAIESQYGSFSTSASFSPCCYKSGLEYDSRFKSAIDRQSACEQISSDAVSSSERLNQNVLNTMKQHLNEDPSLKWQYFGSEKGIMTIYPANKFKDCTSYDPRYRPWYVSAATPTIKEVVVIIDHSGSMATTHGSHSLMYMAQKAALTVLETLGPDDLVGVVGFSSSAATASGCFSNQLAVATPQSVEKLSTYVNSLYARGGTSYVSGLRKAFTLFENSRSMETPTGKTRKKVILFLTDGVPNEGHDIIMDSIRTENAKLNNSVIILTYGLTGLGSSLGTSAMSILQRMANQDTADLNVGRVKPGLFTMVDNPDKLRSSMASYYDFFSKSTDGDTAVVSVPYFDAFGLGMITTVSLPVYHGGSLQGVVGIDIPLGDLFAEAIFDRHYVFLIDSKGRTLVHPLLPQPTNVSDEPVIVTLDLLERNVDAAFVMKSMKEKQDGSKTFVSDHLLSRGDSLRDGVVKQSLESTYYWRSVNGTDFSVCLVMVTGDVELQISGMPAVNKVVYRRIDEKTPQQTCQHFQRISTVESSVVKLSPNCFSDPVEYFETTETESSIRKIEDYLSYKTNENPGLKPEIRDTVSLTSKADDLWLITNSELGKSAAWRYIGTYNGVIRVIPGVKLSKDYSPTQRPWYRRALSQPGKSVASTPYLDAFGAGYVVTLSYTIYKGSSSGTHSSSDTVVAIVGADFTLGYLYQLLVGKFSPCLTETYSCYIIDNSGYIVIHKDFIEAKSSVLPEVEYVHITVKEKSLAEWLISENYMKQQGCLDVSEMRNQKSWQIDLRGSSYIERKLSSTKFEVWAIANSNFYIVVKSETHSSSSSCSCSHPSTNSVHDYQCSSQSCQCPCYADAGYQYCEDKLVVAGSTYPSCYPEAPPLNITPTPVSEKNKAAEMKFCFQQKCTEIMTRLECLSMIGCSWCSRNSNGQNLDKPYCAFQEKCYLGVEGMENPYAMYKPDDKPDGTPEEGNQTGLIIGCACAGIVFLVIVSVACRCYFKKVNAGASQHSQPTRYPQVHTDPRIRNNDNVPSLASAPPYNPAFVAHDKPPSYDDSVALGPTHGTGPGGADFSSVEYGPPFAGSYPTGDKRF